VTTTGFLSSLILFFAMTMLWPQPAVYTPVPLLLSMLFLILCAGPAWLILWLVGKSPKMAIMLGTLLLSSGLTLVFLKRFKSPGDKCSFAGFTIGLPQTLLANFL
jgi:hypothetical protein